MQIGILGGTFDPIHIGHLLCAEAVCEAYGLERVWIVPAAVPPHKRPDPKRAPAEDRCAMAGLAVRDHPRLAVSRVELDRDGPSYTIDTVRAFQAACGPGVDVSWIVGADALAEFEMWRDHEALLDLCRFIGVLRPPHDVGAIPDWLRERVEFFEMTAIDLSSTDIRERVSSGRSIRYRTPDAVARYIRANGLYR